MTRVRFIPLSHSLYPVAFALTTLHVSPFSLIDAQVHPFSPGPLPFAAFYGNTKFRNECVRQNDIRAIDLNVISTGYCGYGAISEPRVSRSKSREIIRLVFSPVDVFLILLPNEIARPRLSTNVRDTKAVLIAAYGAI